MLCLFANTFGIISWGVCSLIDNIASKASFTKHLPAYLSQISRFVIINADKDNPIIRQQIPCQQQTGINHAAPVGMKASVGIGVLEQAVAVLTQLSTLTTPLFPAHPKIVGIDNVVSGVVRRVYVPTDFDTKRKSPLWRKTPKKA